MEKLEFRTLRADEIECRIASVSQYGAQLLLYKDARCDQNILDEKVGPMNWQRHHSRDNANCIVSIWDEDKAQWIEKEDTGIESRADGTGNEKKGLASDSFKRACFNWGIGRELYTAPAMFVNPKDLSTFKKEDNGRYTCRDYFTVKHIEYIEKKIVFVRIYNEKKKCDIEFGTPVENVKRQQSINSQCIEEKYVNTLIAMIDKAKVTAESVLDKYNVNTFNEMTFEQFNDAMGLLSKRVEGE